MSLETIDLKVFMDTTCAMEALCNPPETKKPPPECLTAACTVTFLPGDPGTTGGGTGSGGGSTGGGTGDGGTPCTGANCPTCNV